MTTRDVKTLAGAWESFERSVLATAGPVQRREMRRAFYAGAAGVIGLIMNQLEAGDDATPGDLAMMDSVLDEINAFGRAVTEGKA